MSRRTICRWCGAAGANPADALHPECRERFVPYMERLCDPTLVGSVLPDDWFVGVALQRLFSWFEILSRSEDGGP